MTLDRAPQWRRFLRLVRANVPADVDDELTFHLEMRVERNIALGMSPEDARREAIERFGDVGSVRAALVDHDCRRQTTRQRAEYVADLVQDLKFGVRALRRSPAFTIAAVLTLSLGIGANTAIFSVVNAVVLQPLPYERADRLVTIDEGSIGEYIALRDRLHAIVDLAAWMPATHPVDVDGEAARLKGVAITTNLLPLLGVSPIIGHGFATSDGNYGAGNVLLISHAFWQREFAGTHDIIGRTVSIEGSPFTIVGVMPASFHFPSNDVEYWQPIIVNPSNPGLVWGIGGRRMMGRLASNATLSQTRSELQSVWPSLRRINPLWDPGPEYRAHPSVTPLQTELVGSARALLWMLFGATLLVLIIACVNVANLLLARAVMRERELAVRAALGGGRARLVRQLATESLVLAALGALLGVTLGWLAVRVLVAAMPAGIPRADEISMSGSVLAFALAISIGAGLLFGLIPAFRATSASHSQSSGTAGDRRATAGGSHLRISGALVAGEVALAVMLVSASVLLVRSFAALRAIEPGFETTHVVAARISVPGARFTADTQGVLAYYQNVLNRTQALPGVHGAALVDQLPLAQPVWGIAARVAGQFEDFTRTLPMIEHMQIVTPGYFSTMGIPVRRGRAFDDRDRAGAPLVTIVSQSVARRYWPSGDAIGQRLGFPYASPWMTVVGVVSDTKQDSLRDTTSASMYVPWAQASGRFTGDLWLVTRTAVDAASTGTTIRTMVHDIDPGVPVSDVRTMSAVVSGSVSRSRFTTSLVGAFALLALALGAVGIYGVMSYLVGERRREMGIRIALGASRASVMRIVLQRATWLASVGAAIGIAGAMVATRSLRQWLYGVSATDPVTFLFVPILFLAVAVLASSAPALRATRADPASTLREE
ncbi:MAG TPA: ABC transporter permease [Gemmatimonadaceae bacterium]|nr:ABC transporter permease [Gemmatimonadaceae bacterium]